MKLKNILFGLLAVVMITTVSCSKEKGDNPFTDALSNTTWVGNIDGNPLAFKFGTDAKVTYFQGGLNAPVASQFTGTYSFSNAVVLLSVTSPNNVTFSFGSNVANNQLNGTWGLGPKNSGGGNFNATKQ